MARWRTLIVAGDPICSYCRKIRDDEHTGSTFSHGICPSCLTDIVEPLLEGDHA